MAGQTTHDHNPTPGLEWPTLVLALVIYAGWLAATWYWRALPLPLLFVAGGWLIAWQSSLQHETIHGHPTRSRRFNEALGWPPLSLWLPYASYRDSHTRHHRTGRLTDPLDDPESGYVSAAAWKKSSVVERALASFQMTLLGRLTFGTLAMIFVTLRQELHAIVHGNRRRRRIWCAHMLGVALVLLWVTQACGMPLWLYLVAFVLPGAALTRLRAFAEHRWAKRLDERTVVVESWLFGLLFLHNNLHVAHHLYPAAPWYRLPGLYRELSIELHGRQGRRVYRGYREVAWRFLLRRYDTPRYPGRLSPDA